MGTVRFEQHLAAISVAAHRLGEEAWAAGPDAAVPTCPGWSVRDLVAHQGMVHRWATAVVLGDSDAADSPDGFREEGLAESDPVEWLIEGSLELVEALEDAHANLKALVFLKDAPSARDFWARRQCHETTIHAFDALSAHLARMPSANDAEIDPPFAADGLDELLTGFLPRSKSRLRSDALVRIAVSPIDVDAAWLVAVSQEPAVTTRHTSDSGELATAKVRFSGTAAQLYLGLWNRGNEIVTTDEAMLTRWREVSRVEW
ncbi:hypothetical protein ASG74_08250 [Knoellia sp. Soil729]|nr:hypothetical protein ASG74_08250 [Knoellia sp. Soil729]